jgi:hypothetical protein
VRPDPVAVAVIFVIPFTVKTVSCGTRLTNLNSEPGLLFSGVDEDLLQEIMNNAVNIVNR